VNPTQMGMESMMAGMMQVCSMMVGMQQEQQQPPSTRSPGITVFGRLQNKTEAKMQPPPNQTPSGTAAEQLALEDKKGSEDKPEAVAKDALVAKGGEQPPLLSVAMRPLSQKRCRPLVLLAKPLGGRVYGEIKHSQIHITYRNYNFQNQKFRIPSTKNPGSIRLKIECRKSHCENTSVRNVTIKSDCSNSKAMDLDKEFCKITKNWTF